MNKFRLGLEFQGNGLLMFKHVKEHFNGTVLKASGRFESFSDVGKDLKGQLLAPL